MIDLFVVTGAPGAGKSTTVEQLLKRDFSDEFAVFDIDWLINSASELIGTRIQDSPESWQPYAKLWFDVLHATVRNGQTPIFFCPNTKEDFALFGHPEWCSDIHWLLLDCAEPERRARLEQREWTRENIDAALVDARELSRSSMPVLDTSTRAPEAVASHILTWARNPSGDNV